MTIRVRITHEDANSNRQIHAFPCNKGEAEKNASQGVFIDPGMSAELFVHSQQDIRVTEVLPEAQET